MPRAISRSSYSATASRGGCAVQVEAVVDKSDLTAAAPRAAASQRDQPLLAADVQVPIDRWRAWSTTATIRAREMVSSD